MAVNDSQQFRPYQPRTYPKLDGGLPRYTMQELSAISASLQSVYQILQELEARIAALGG